VPGFDMVVKKIYGFIGERGIRLLFQADRRAGGPQAVPPPQRAVYRRHDHAGLGAAARSIRVQTPFVNAGAYGMDKPFIVINSGALKLPMTTRCGRSWATSWAT